MEEMAQWGVAEQEAQAWLEQQEPDDQQDDSTGGPPDGSPEPPLPRGSLLVWPCNVPVYRLFMGLQTQWQRNDFSGALECLNYPAAQSHMSIAGLLDERGRAPELWGQLQEMERAAVEASQDAAE